ncbi:hypothetical protein O3M35_008227 [Rhynocoris fuscipes]|uniref:Uncharacterized protein n=1 Tax=Rhynocoris fuscipes TaxID=488301 RepID=A0AAW1D871_9HEMI
MPWNVHSGELTGAILWLFTESETNGNVCNMFSKPCSSHTFDYSNEIFIEAVEFKGKLQNIKLFKMFSI